MTETAVQIGRATGDDLEGILALQAENQPDRGGRLSASFPRSLIAEIMRYTPVIVARSDGRVVGYLVTSTKRINAGIPIIEAMLAAYAGADDSHVYGPICVDAKYRGKGLAQAMFAQLRRFEPEREYVLFVRRDNPLSLRAHAKMGMREVAAFGFRGNEYVVLSSIRGGE